MHDRDDVVRILTECKTIAVLGVSTKPQRAGYYVPDYLKAYGYRILPVNPNNAGKVLFGETVRATLAEIDERVDMVDVFRRPELLWDHVPDILAMKPLPKVVWFQLGISNESVADELRAYGIEVVQDRCTLADHRRWMS